MKLYLTMDFDREVTLWYCPGKDKPKLYTDVPKEKQQYWDCTGLTSTAKAHELGKTRKFNEVLKPGNLIEVETLVFAKASNTGSNLKVKL